MKNFIRLADLYTSWWNIGKETKYSSKEDVEFVQYPPYQTSYKKRGMKNYYLQGVFRPVDSEVHLCIDHNHTLFNYLEGSVFCQIGSNPKHIGTRDAGYHWFDGDGMVHAAFFEKHRIHYTNHWIQTKRLRAEKKWGQKMYLYFGELHGFHGMMQILKWSIIQYFALIPGQKGTANTALIEWKNRLYALHEGDMPYEIALDKDGHEVYTYDQWTLPHIKSVTAHPKIDLRRNRLYFYGYNNYDFQQGIFFNNEFDADMNLIRRTNHTLLNNGMIHDIAQTKNHLIIPDLPLKYDVNQIMKDKLPLVFDKKGITRFGVIPKDNPEKIDWYTLEGDNMFIFHFCNARETRSGFQTYACTMDFLDMMDFVHLENSEFKIRGNLRLQKLVFYKNEKRVKIEKNQFIEKDMTSIYPEFPKEYNLDFPLLSMNKCYIYCSVFDAKSGRIVGFIKVDTLNFSRTKPKAFILRDRFINSEPQVVQIYQKEYLLAFTYGNNETNDTCLSLINVDDQTIEQIAIPTRIPPGFHSFFKSSRRFRTGRK